FTEPILMADVPFVELFHKAKWAQVTPITYVIDKNGIVRYALRGRQEAATVRQAIAAVGG
ncbi:MAG: peroxiredoxin, partial [Planctomycetota bacterium]